MARRKAAKNISLMRATYVNGARSLQDYVTRACAAVPVLPNREVAHPGHGTLRINHHLADRNGVFIHLVAKFTGEAAATVGETGGIVNDQEVPVAPPPRRAFKNADLFALIKGNNLAICTDGIRYQALEYYLRNFFGVAGVDHRAAQFDIERVANVDAIAKLHRGGVKEIQIQGTLYEATFDRVAVPARRIINRSLRDAVINLTDQLAAVFHKDDNEEIADNSENLQVQVIIKAEGGVRSAPMVLRQMEAVGVDLVQELNDDFEYVIKTNNNRTITSSEMIVMQPVLLERMENQNSLSRTDVWEALSQAMERFRIEGELEL